MCLRNVDEDLEDVENLFVHLRRSASAEVMVDHGSQECVRTDADYAPVAETVRTGRRWEWFVENGDYNSVVKKAYERLKAAADGSETVVRRKVAVDIVRMAKPRRGLVVRCSLLQWDFENSGHRCHYPTVAAEVAASCGLHIVRQSTRNVADGDHRCQHPVVLRERSLQ